MSSITNVSRRGFLKGLAGAGALVLGAYYVPKALRHDEGASGRTDADRATLHPNAFVGIDTDGTVYIVAHRSEMGTVIRTTLPMVVADELDADWKKIKIDQAIGDRRYGDQNTDGSHSVRSFFDVMRQAGATARLMLILAAAQKWGVPPTDCQTDLHAVVHPHTGRRLGYGELASAASTSISRSVFFIVRATTRRTEFPVSWPRRSFTSLKPIATKSDTLLFDL